MAKKLRSVALVVDKPGACPLLRARDRWLIEGTEVQAAPGARLCLNALCAAQTQLAGFLAGTEKSAPKNLACGHAGCKATFAVEDIIPDAGLTRRMERRAEDAGKELQKSGPFLSRLDPALTVQIVGEARKTRYPAGHVVLPEGTPGENLFIVSEGEVEVVRRSPKDGSETVLAVLGQGECFGEMALLTGLPTSATVRARRDSAIFSLTKTQLNQFLARSTDLNRIFSSLLADRLRALNTVMRDELGRGILGKLSMISVPDLVQTLSASRRTGTLVLTGAKGLEGRVVFRQGQVAAAQFGVHDAEKAFLELALWTEGDFCFEPDGAGLPDEARIKMDTMGLLMDAMRRLDDLRRANG